MSVEEGYRAARNAALNALAQLKAAAGDLEKVVQIVRLEGYVLCSPGFNQHAQVLNGASDLLTEVLGERGKHTRIALGSNDLPLNAALELVLVAEVYG